MYHYIQTLLFHTWEKNQQSCNICSIYINLFVLAACLQYFRRRIEGAAQQRTPRCHPWGRPDHRYPQWLQLLICSFSMFLNVSQFLHIFLFGFTWLRRCSNSPMKRWNPKGSGMKPTDCQDSVKHRHSSLHFDALLDTAWQLWLGQGASLDYQVIEPPVHRGRDMGTPQ